jgi:transposase
MTMEHYAGIDVSLKLSSVCVRDERGTIVREAKIASEPEALVAWFSACGLKLGLIGLEAGPLSAWLYREMHAAGLPVQLIETRHAHVGLKLMPVKTDRNDARGVAEIMRLGWFRPVHCKSLVAQERRALLAARVVVKTKLHDIAMHLRGQLRTFGLKVGRTTPARFVTRVRELVAGNPTLSLIAEALLTVHAELRRQLAALHKQLLAIAREDPVVRRLMTAPAVGAIVALTYAAAVDDPTRFRASKQVGAYFGLTPRKYQSGETDVDGRISKLGDASVRAVLYEAAHVMLTLPTKGGWLKSWGAKLAKRVGLRRAKVAVARKLAVVLHRMWRDGTDFAFANPRAAA